MPDLDYSPALSEDGTECDIVKAAEIAKGYSDAGLRAALDTLALVVAQLRDNGYHDWPDMLERDVLPALASSPAPAGLDAEDWEAIDGCLSACANDPREKSNYAEWYASVLVKVRGLIGHRHPQAEVDDLNARVVVRGADGITTVVSGEVGEVTIDPCPVCGLKRIYQQTEPDSDGMLTASWECPDGHLRYMGRNP